MMQEKTVEKNPFFSIIVPVYKTEQYIEQCIESILAQSMKDFEVILVDDGSPDSCGVICDRYAEVDSRIRVIHKKNGGQSSARSAGFEISRGTYIIHVDSDDYIATDLLERLSEIVCRHCPQAILFNLMQFSDKNKNPLKNRIAPGLYRGKKMNCIREGLIQNEKGEQLILYNLCGMVAMRTKYKDYYNSVPDAIYIGEDLAVVVPFLKSCDNVYVMDFFGYYYRDNPMSVMNTFKIEESNQIKLLASFLSEALGAEYESKIDSYVLMHYFSFLDRGMVQGQYKDYRQLVQKTLDNELMVRIHRAKCTGNIKLRIIFALMRHKCFTALWILRRIKRRVS